MRGYIGTTKLALPVAAGLVAVTFLIGAAAGQAGQPTAATQSPASRPAPQFSDEARAFLNAELRRLRDAGSVRGKSVALWEMKNEGFPGMSIEHPQEFAIAAPNKLWLKTKDMEVWGDGATLTIRSAQLKQFVQAPQPGPDELKTSIEKLSGNMIRSLPGEALLRPSMTLEETLASIRAFGSTRPGEWEGRAGVWISGTAFDEQQPAGAPDFTIERFIASDDGMTAVVKQDWTTMYNAIAQNKHQENLADDPNAAPPRAIEHARWTTRFSRELGAKIDPSAFVFVPQESDAKVESFVFKRPGLEQQVMRIGRALPDMSGTDMDANPISLASFKGKVLVMDFWATWCGPCVQGMPHMQEIMEKYADKPLAMLGVNRDAPGQAQKVKKFLARKKFTIPQFDDSAGKLADLFSVSSIPCVVIVDQQGVVQDVDVGYLPGKEKELAAKIDQLLAGKPLRTPEELKALRRQTGIEQ